MLWVPVLVFTKFISQTLNANNGTHFYYVLNYWRPYAVLNLVIGMWSTETIL